MRKRLTEVFPFLLPLRKKQRKYLFYKTMELDNNIYAKELIDYDLPYIFNTVKSNMINYNTGFDIEYQFNKAFNLRLASNCLNRLIIKKNEVFSLFECIRYADKNIDYKNGLTVVNGKTIPEKGGGLCQLSNILFEVFLNSPLSIIERHGHKVKEFPDAIALKGIDATIVEGWLDLKVKNNTDINYELVIDFNENDMIVSLYSDSELNYQYEIKNENLVYYYDNNHLIEEVDVVRLCKSKQSNEIIEKQTLYRNQCIIDYDIKNIEIRS